MAKERRHNPTSREIRRSDDVYNARRRFRRQAERYMKKAETSSGLARSRYEAQARNAIMNAMRTYQGSSKPQGQVRAIAERLGVTDETFRVQSALRGAQAGRSGRVSQSQLNRLIERSMGTLASAERPDRDEMARQLLSIDNVGSRFYGGLSDIWTVDEESRQHPNRAILRYFNAESLMDVLEAIEDWGIDIYSPTENKDIYKSQQLRLQEYVASHGKA